MYMFLNKKQFEAAKDYAQVEVDMTAEWGGKVLVRSMSVGQNLELTKPGKDQSEFAFDLILACCINADGTLLFDDPINDRALLKAKDAKHIAKLYQAIEKINGLNPKDPDELAKNS